jgi:23S rRNA A2030 N6-methylase RlmJ
MAKTTDEERKSKLRQAYSQATQELREENRDRFNELYAEKAAELDVEWSPRRTAEQKAEDVFDSLLAEYPHLRERVGQTAT